MEIYVREDGSLGIRGKDFVPPARATGVGDAIYLYSTGGLFGVSGMHPTLVNAMVGPSGVETIFTWVGSDEETPMYDAITYIGTSTRDQASSCAVCGKPEVKECTQIACFGRYCQQTDEIVFDKIGLRMNRGVPTMVLFGNITDPAGNIIVAKGEAIRDVFTLNVAAAGYNLRLDVGQQMWIGNPANNVGGRHEFPGLNIIINTGKYDALTNILCPALDSTLLNFANNVVGAPGSPSIHAYITSLIRSILYRVDTAGLNRASVEGYLVMHPRTWDCVARAVACEYGLVCAVGAATRNDAMAIADFRDKMINNAYLPVDGRDWPVVLDNLMPYNMGALYDGQNNFCSDIAFIVTRVDGRTVTWGEYQDLNKTGGAVIADLRREFGQAPLAVTDGGRFVSAPEFSGGFCFDVKVLTKPRIIAQMPQLLGRVQNVCCAPLGTYPDVTGIGGIYGLYEIGGGTPTKPYLDLYAPCV